MRRVTTSVLVMAWATWGCSPAPSLTIEEAQAIVADVGRGASRIDICTDEGRATFRAAVRAYSAAQHAQGKVWPNAMGALGGEHMPDAGEVAVMGAMIAGYVNASDLSGDAQRFARMMNMSINLNDRRHLFRDGMAEACAEVMELQQLLAREQIDAEQAERRALRAEERGDEARAAEIRRAVYERAQRTRDDVARLSQAIEAKIAAGKG